MELIEATKRKYAELIAPYVEAREKRGLRGKVKRRHRRHVWKQALARANNELPKLKRPADIRCRKPAKDPELRKVYYRAKGMTPTGGVIMDTFAGGRGHASSAGYKFDNKAECRKAYLLDPNTVAGMRPKQLLKAIDAGYRGPLPEDHLTNTDVVSKLTNPDQVAEALDAGYSGPLHEQLDDDAVAAKKTGLFAKIWGMRKLFG